MASTHQLAVILFADIAGYTGMMQKDEQHALKLLERFKDVLEALTPKFQGKIVQYFGDACLLAFDSAVASVECAMALQNAFKETPVLPARVGLHLGDVVFTNENVYGDGVNIASRIESLGVAGAILMSKSVRDHIKNQSQFLLVELGSFDLKNVDEPMRVFALANPGFVVPKREQMKGKLKQSKKQLSPLVWISLVFLLAVSVFAAYFSFNKRSRIAAKESTHEKSIAVIPFNMIGNDSAGKYFADGVEEALKRYLQGIKNLRIRSRRSVEKYADSDKSIPEIARELEVDYIINGSVQKYKDKDDILVYINLVDSEKDSNLLKRAYPRKFADIFKVQGEIALNIVSSLNLTLSEKPTKNKEAWDLYLRGMSYIRNFGKYREQNDALFAIDFFTRAIQKDTTFALAYTWLTWALVNKDVPDPADRKKTMDSVIMLLEKSIHLDPELGETYHKLGLIYSQFLNDFDKAIQYFEKGISIEPDNADLYAGMALTLSYQNKYLEALAYSYRSLQNEPGEVYAYSLRDIGVLYSYLGEFGWAEVFLAKALELEPDDLVFLEDMSVFRILQGYYDEVLKLANKSLSIRENNDRGLKYLCKAYLLLGEYTKAEIAHSQSPHYPGKKTEYAQVLRKLGKEKEALKLINELKELLEKEMPDANYALARVYSFLGEKKKALQHLSKWKVIEGMHLWVEKEPLFENIKNEPEFKQLVQRFKSEVEVLRKEARKKIASGEFPTPEMIRQ